MGVRVVASGAGGKSMVSIRRREFITLFGGAVVWPLAAHA
jgi:hypothetical protein